MVTLLHYYHTITTTIVTLKTMTIIINQEQGNRKSEFVSKNDAKLADTIRVKSYDRNSKQGEQGDRIRKLE